MTNADTVLIVDDNEIARFITEQVLLDMDLAKNIQIANNGNEALRLIKKGLKPDLILLDLDMPGMDGFSFLNAYQALPDTLHLHPNVVVFSTSARHQDRETANNYTSVIGFAEKPVTQRKLQLLLNKVAS